VSGACQLIGHRYRYYAEGDLVRWVCMRGCGESGSRPFATPRQARRHAAALNRHERGVRRWRLSSLGRVRRRRRER